MPAPSEDSPYRLLVEGEDDMHTILHLLKRHQFDWDDEGTVWVKQAGGWDRLRARLRTELKSDASGLRRVGVVADANANPAGRWQAIGDALRDAGVEVPAALHAAGVILNQPQGDLTRRVGVWLMPNNLIAGKLEHFIATLVPDSELWSHADEATVKARQLGAGFPVGDHIKSRLHAWLAWQPEPWHPYGTAIGAQTLRHDSPDAQRFVQWFRRLFIEA